MTEAKAVVLETLLELLRAGQQMPGAVDPTAVATRVGELAKELDHEPGIGSLMRLWDGAMPRRRGAAPYSAEELRFLLRWFGDLSSYKQGLLPRADVSRLVDFSGASNWMPELSSAFASKLGERLAANAPADVVASADAVAPPSAQEPSASAEDAPAGEVMAFVGADVIPTHVEADAFVAADSATANVDTDADAFVPADAIAPTADAAFAFDTPWPAEESAGQSATAEQFAFTPDTHATAPDADGAFAPHDHAPAAFDDEEAVAFDFPPPSAGSLPTAGVAPTAAAAPDDANAIWISEDERHLTLQAINEQLLPLAQHWAHDGPVQDVLEEIAYQGDLVVNVLDIVGTATLAEGMRHVLRAAAPPEPSCDGPSFADWCTGLLATIEMPAADTAALLAMMSLPFGLDDAWGARLQDEMARVRIGMNPAFLAELQRDVTEEDLRLTPADDVLPSVLDGMLRELPGNVARLGDSIRTVVDEGDLTPLDEARRAAHTLKGDGNTVGVRGLATLTHAMEDILVELVKSGQAPNRQTGELLTLATDTVDEIADHLLGRGPEPADLGDVCRQLNAFNAALQADPELATRVDAELPDAVQATPHAPQPSARPKAAPAMLQEQAETVAHRTLTLDSALLDDIQDVAGESLVNSRRIDLMLANVANAYRDQTQASQNAQLLLQKLDDLVALRGAALQSTAQQLGEGAMDPLEIDQYNELHVISRQLAENHADTQDSLRALERSFRALADLRSAQELTNTDLQRRILRTRLVPFSQVSARLQRIVRQTAKQVMKSVSLEIHGEEALLDAELLERVVEPLGHMLRNAIDHGIEDPAIRRTIGKPEHAELRLDVSIRGDSAYIDLRDDGRGLDLQAIRRKSIELGLLQPGEDIADQALSRMILIPGFTTRDQTTELSGRGVGMDVVNRRVQDMRGLLQLDSETGKGLHVQLRLPVSATIANVIVVNSERHTTAVVAGAVQSIVQVPGDAISFDAERGRMTASVGGMQLDAVPLDTLYGDNVDVAALREKGSTGLLVQTGAVNPMIVLIHSVVEVNSVIVKPISPDIPPIPAVRGLAQLADGRLAPVTDLDQLLGRSESDAVARRVQIGSHVQQTRVLVADDSLSVRRSMQQLMEDAGYEVVAAADGLEALALIESKPVSACLLDMEMPRMNGLDLTRALRVRDGGEQMPIIMITSRSSDKHREMALEAGVTTVLTKPVADDELTALVNRLVAESTLPTATAH